MFRIFGAVLAAVCATVFTGCESRDVAAPGYQDAPASGFVQTEETENTEETGEDVDAVDAAEAAVPEILSGAWFNAENMEEKWTFKEGGVLTVGDKEHTYLLRRSLLSGEILKIDSESYGFSVYGGSDLYIYDRVSGAPAFTLYSEDNDIYVQYLRNKRVESECADLLERYPDKDGWIDNINCGDIPFLADADYIDTSLKDGIFRAGTPEQLASFCWFVNTQEQGLAVLEITGDIDLSGYEWAPMGWVSEHAFCGYVSGGGHTIKNMTINRGNVGYDAGFIGWETFCCVYDLAFDGAKVSGSNAGVVAGQAIGGSYQNITITNSTVDGGCAGSMLGWDANTTKKNCTADVLVNGEKFEFLSYNEYEKSKIVIEDPVEITIDENHTVTRPEVEGYTNLGWMVFFNGEQVLHRNAEDELSYTYFLTEPGQYEIYLTAFVSGQYVPISNTVSYTIE